MSSYSNKADVPPQIRRRPQSSKNPNQSSLLTNNVLYLKRSHVTFEAPTQRESVFFDECNREIISLTIEPESKTKVIVQSTDKLHKIQFSLPVGKRILSIKFNPSQTVLAYHVEKSNVEFINVKTTDGSPSTFLLEDRRYIQASRTKNGKLFGFLWTGQMELVMVTDISIEYYHVDAARHRLRHLKTFQSTTNWFVYQPESHLAPRGNDHMLDSYSVLMVSTGSFGNSMQPYMFTRNQIIKLQRFDVEGDWHGNDKSELFERSVTIASIYGSVRLLVLQHESLNVKSRGAQILIYTIDPESGVTTKTHTLDLDVSGRFAINILDNLVIAHDQPSKSSFIFDIMVVSTEKSDCPSHFVGLIDSQPIKPLQLEGQDGFVDMYSLNWVFFQPNFIIDAKMGLLSTLHLDLSLVQTAIQDNLMLLNFLSHRIDSKEIILDKCKSIVEDAYKSATQRVSIRGSPLADVSAAFEVLGELVVSAPELDKKIERLTTNATALNEEKVCLKFGPSIAQEDVHQHIFNQLDRKTRGESLDSSDRERELVHLHFISSALLEFIFVVRREGKVVECCIYEQLLKCLVGGKRFFQLIQMIRHEIFVDSKQLACLLLSLRDQYPSAAQLGLDMLQRLGCSPHTSSYEPLWHGGDQVLLESIFRIELGGT